MVDVGKTIMWNCCKHKKLDFKLTAELLRGYETKRKLNKKEKSYLKNSILFGIFSHIWGDLYHVSVGYIPENYTISLIRNFLPIARKLEKNKLFPS